jgi:Tfp pilus assembly protein PilF
MADKESKLFLKDALENIKKKDYEKALKDAKKVLNKDKHNYKALIFCGLCLSELDQNEKALQVAS